MKINEIELQVGITKKNIRFYEDQGLIQPERNKMNGYREYKDSDVELLLKIKLLRKLGVPIEEIRNIRNGRLSLEECLERHEIILNHEMRNIELVRELCREIASASDTFSDLEAKRYLNQLEALEKGENRFMNIEKKDVKKKKQGAIIAAMVMIIGMILWDLFILYVNHYDPAPTGLIAVLILLPTCVIVGVLLALKERMKEIEGGEEDEACKY